MNEFKPKDFLTKGLHDVLSESDILRGKIINPWLISRYFKIGYYQSIRVIERAVYYGIFKYIDEDIYTCELRLEYSLESPDVTKNILNNIIRHIDDTVSVSGPDIIIKSEFHIFKPFIEKAIVYLMSISDEIARQHLLQIHARFNSFKTILEN